MERTLIHGGQVVESTVEIDLQLLGSHNLKFSLTELETLTIGKVQHQILMVNHPKFKCQ
jgi:hypothetical protein